MPPQLRLATYADLVKTWPTQGRTILAQHDRESVVVYQAYRPSIARYAVERQRFGGEFQLNRMSWIKPNFLWMMYRSGWGTKPGQEVVLAVHLRRAAFDEILSLAVQSTFEPAAHISRYDWQRAMAASDVRFQWDPDHDPQGRPLSRRAIQLGLRGSALARYAGEWLLGIEDISGFVAEQRGLAGASKPDGLVVPVEEVYEIRDRQVAEILGVVSRGSKEGDV